MDNLSLGARLRTARENAGLTQNEVAQRLGITYQAVSNYERDKCRIESGIFVQLCILYNVSASDLLIQPIWSVQQNAMYQTAKTPQEKLLLFALWGIPDELQAEYARLSGNKEAAAPEGDGQSTEETMLIALFRQVPSAIQGAVLGMIEGALKHQGLL